MLNEDGVTYIATLGGRIELERVAETAHTTAQERIWISPLLVLDEVTLSTGNVEFDGSVYIRGNVGAGTMVKATEELIVDGYVEAAVLQCGGNMLLKQGMNAVGEGSIRAGGSVNGNFFEAVRIHAGGDIQANYCLNCELYAEGTVAMLGSKGSISGGHTYAAKGIQAYHIGNRAGIETVVELGANEQTRKRQLGIETKRKDVEQELLILGNSYMDFQRKYSAEVRNAMPLYLKIESAIYTKEKELQEIQAKMQQAEEEKRQINTAKAVIKGCLYEGTLVEIDCLRWRAKEARNITLKKVDDRIAVFAN